MQGHGLRATFASVAEELVSGGALKRMLNHATGGDVTLGHYVGKSEAQLRAAWQTVADFIEAEAAKEAQPGPALPVRSGRRVQRGSTVPAVAKRRRPSRGAQAPSSEGAGSQSISERV